MTSPLQLLFSPLAELDLEEIGDYTPSTQLITTGSALSVFYTARATSLISSMIDCGVRPDGGGVEPLQLFHAGTTQLSYCRRPSLANFTHEQGKRRTFLISAGVFNVKEEIEKNSFMADVPALVASNIVWYY